MVTIVKEVLIRLKFWKNADRIGPDIPITYFKLYFPSAAKKLCEKKFLKFGKNAQFRPGAYAVGCSNISIGKNVVIRPNCMLFSENSNIIIEDDVLIGSGVQIYVNNHEYNDISKLISEQGHMQAKNVVLKEGCWIGANAIILPGVEIGKNSVVGAGSIVTKSVENYTVVGGNPAKVIKFLV